MKKFLIFLVAIVCVVCAGLTTYYFMRNDEIINVETKELFVNVGDTISLDSLGITRKKPSKKTTFDYNAGGNDVTKYIKYDESTGVYSVIAGGTSEVKLVISTNNKKFSKFSVLVHIGSGEEGSPYYIFNETQLKKINTIYGTGKYYSLKDDISLTKDFAPINNFSGDFDGNGFTISGFTYSADAENAGLFSSISGRVYDLRLKNFNISGSYNNVGALAGQVTGNVSNVVANQVVINNNRENANTGAMFGSANNASIVKVGVDNANVTAISGNIGGFAGVVNKGVAQATYTNAVVNAQTSDTVGGYAGKFVIGDSIGTIQQSYAKTNVSSGAFVGTIDSSVVDKTRSNVLVHLVGNIAVGESSSIVANYDNAYFKEGFIDESSDTYMIQTLANANNIVKENLIAYAISDTNICYWDINNIWAFKPSNMPTLQLNNVYPSSPSPEYYTKDLSFLNISKSDEFITQMKNYNGSVNNGVVTWAERKLIMTSDIDISSSAWTPIAKTGFILDGGNYTLTIKLGSSTDGFVGLFSVLDTCQISNLKIKVVGVADATNAFGGLAGKIVSTATATSTTINNVNVAYESNACNFTNATKVFGGIVGIVETNSIVENSTAEVEFTSDYAIGSVGGIVGINNGKLSSVSANVKLNGGKYIGGIVAQNNGAITSVADTTVVVKDTSTTEYIGGLVGFASSTSAISFVEANVNVDIAKTTNKAYIAGIVGYNEGSIKNAKISGKGIVVSAIDNQLWIAGVSAVNNGNIELAQINVDQIGSYHVYKNQYVGGLVVENQAVITKSVVNSQIYGNVVAGAVVYMNSTEASIDQILIGNIDKDNNGEYNRKVIQGDKYVAGLVFDFKYGTATNIQAISSIVGGTTSTISSLNCLMFNNGTKMTQVTIDSEISGLGSKYRDTWKDFETIDDSLKKSLGYSETSAGWNKQGRFNLYTLDSSHGIMQNVVINENNAGVKDAIASMGTVDGWFFGLNHDYENTANSSYIKTTEDFYNAESFQGSFTFKCADGKILFGTVGQSANATKTLNYDIGGIWSVDGGIKLSFLSSL